MKPRGRQVLTDQAENSLHFSISLPNPESGIKFDYGVRIKEDVPLSFPNPKEDCLVKKIC